MFKAVAIIGFVLALINMGIAIHTGNLSAFCGWGAAAIYCFPRIIRF